ncbi:MAG: hypothetical protein H6744_00420 [Deltaproteobacteria bacterium]|nr:hypothetical protein [Deltaproteobacteria bacterium]MCB9785129.1 hypothetical protein [Deltaproteobacteria bacterium]
MRPRNHSVCALLAGLLGVATVLAGTASAAPDGAAAPTPDEAAKAAPAAEGAAPAADAASPEQLSPEERLRRASVGAPGKECILPDETADEQRRARLRLDSDLATVASQTVTQARLITADYWRSVEREILGEVAAMAATWNIQPGLAVTGESRLSNGLTGGLIQTCRVAASNDPERCWDVGKGEDAAMCHAWASIWKQSSGSKNCDGVPEEYLPICRMAISGDISDCKPASPRAQKVCGFIQQSRRADWNLCDDPSNFQACLSLLFARSTDIGQAACNELIAKAPEDAPRRALFELCQASLSGDPDKCPDEEWTRLSKAPEGRTVRAEVVGGVESPSLYMVAAAVRPCVCQVDVTMRSGEQVERRSRTLVIGGPPNEFPPLALPVSFDPFDAHTELSKVCVPAPPWTSSRP